jgi:hypothetical protein
MRIGRLVDGSELQELQGRLDELGEIYAGMEGTLPHSRLERYLALTVRQMYAASLPKK